MSKEDGKIQHDKALDELLKRASQNKELPENEDLYEDLETEDIIEEKTVEKADEETDVADTETKNEKAEKAFKKLTGMDDEDAISVSFRTIIGGDVLAGRWFRRQLKYLIFLAGLAIVYVSNRYACQRETIENIELTHVLEDRRLRAVVATSNLTEYTRRSNIQSQLADSTLKSSPAPFYYLQTNQ